MELCEEGNQGTPAPPFAEYRSDPLLLMNFKLAKVLLKSGVSAGTAVHYIINWKLTKGQQERMCDSMLEVAWAIKRVENSHRENGVLLL